MSEGVASTFNFSGPWVGETIGHNSPAHIWEIDVRGRYVGIRSCWEGESNRSHMSGYLAEDAHSFVIGRHRAIPVGDHHFVIEKWDTNDVRNNKGRNFDVVFSRPGIAELQAREMYRQYQDEKPVREAAEKIAAEKRSAQTGRAPLAFSKRTRRTSA
jgi:hypothetical protein